MLAATRLSVGNHGLVLTDREDSSEMGKGEGISRLPYDTQARTRVDQPDTADPPRVVIADDHPFFRTSTARLLRDNGVEVAAEVGSGEAAVNAVRETTPQVVIMDLKMPGLSGLEATRRLTGAYPAARVVVLSVSASDDDVIDAVLAGASGYVLKDSSPGELIAAVRAAAAGEPLVSQRVAAALLGRIREALSNGEGLAGVGLSGHELRILDALAAGRPSDEIGAELDLNADEVREYVSSLLVKLRVDSAVRAALRDEDD